MVLSLSLLSLGITSRQRTIKVKMKDYLMGEGERDAQGGAFRSGRDEFDVTVVTEQHTLGDGETETSSIWPAR